ncbi:MAG: exodeoxyribonuclease III [Candidatus Marsarchaeota archaeon]|nr:exodeoxyribonuclease III [Candidatus Marsarchaeota archaeon]
MKTSLISWNVNGIRAAKAEALKLIKSEKPDIMAFQEIKADGKAVPEEFYKLGYLLEINPAAKKGYSGTMSMVRKEPLSKLSDFEDDEGRVQAMEFADFYFINSYFPNSRRDLSRLGLKHDFNAHMLKYIKQLEKKKPVVVCGDFNVAHKEIDIARPKENVRNAGFTSEERSDMDEFIGSGLVDTFRIFNKQPGNYTWWSYMSNARAKNIGWRIDYFLVSKSLKNRVESAAILKDITGSDHVPVKLILDADM